MPMAHPLVNCRIEIVVVIIGNIHRTKPRLDKVTKRLDARIHQRDVGYLELHSLCALDVQEPYGAQVGR